MVRFMTQLTVGPGGTRPASTALFVMPIVAVGVLLSGFDLFVVNVALDGIAASVGGSNLADLSWVLNAYTITFAALLVPAGRIGDMVGSKRGFLAGLVIFVVGSKRLHCSPTTYGPAHVCSSVTVSSASKLTGCSTAHTFTW